MVSFSFIGHHPGAAWHLERKGEEEEAREKEVEGEEE